MSAARTETQDAESSDKETDKEKGHSRPTRSGYKPSSASRRATRWSLPIR